MIFQSTRPGWGETFSATDSPFFALFQSTRPGWGETYSIRRHPSTTYDFNPLAPGGARPALVNTFFQKNIFQSTRPGWGETNFVHFFYTFDLHFNPLAPGGARHSVVPIFFTARLFQSTRPGWGETPGDAGGAQGPHISIHSPRVGRDLWAAAPRDPL